MEVDEKERLLKRGHGDPEGGRPLKRPRREVKSLELTPPASKKRIWLREVKGIVPRGTILTWYILSFCLDNVFLCIIVEKDCFIKLNKG